MKTQKHKAKIVERICNQINLIRYKFNCERFKLVSHRQKLVYDNDFYTNQEKQDLVLDIEAQITVLTKVKDSKIFELIKKKNYSNSIESALIKKRVKKIKK